MTRSVDWLGQLVSWLGASNQRILLYVLSSLPLAMLVAAIIHAYHAGQQQQAVERARGGRVGAAFAEVKAAAVKSAIKAEATSTHTSLTQLTAQSSIGTAATDAESCNHAYSERVKAATVRTGQSSDALSENRSTRDSDNDTDGEWEMVGDSHNEFDADHQ